MRVKKGAHAWTPSAAGIASFRSATTKDNIPSKAKAVKWILVVVVVYASQINIILIVLKPIVLPQETYPYIQSPFPASSTVHTDYSNIYK